MKRTLLLAVCLFLTACGPSEEEKRIAERAALEAEDARLHEQDEDLKYYQSKLNVIRGTASFEDYRAVDRRKQAEEIARALKK